MSKLDYLTLLKLSTPWGAKYNFFMEKERKKFIIFNETETGNIGLRDEMWRAVNRRPPLYLITCVSLIELN
jgi:hypothetical protein